MSLREKNYRFVEGSRGISLCLPGFKPLVRLVRDIRYPSMWRIKRRDGSLTDMVNLTRAMDVALDIGDRELRERIARRHDPAQTSVEGAPMRFSGGEVP
jgi:hypothetical protein